MRLRKAHVMRPITIRFPRDLVRLAKIHAATQDFTFQKLMTDALENYLRAHGVDVSVMPTASTPTATAA